MLNKEDLALFMEMINSNSHKANIYERHLQTYYKALYSGIPELFLDASMVCELDIKHYKTAQAAQEINKEGVNR